MLPRPCTTCRPHPTTIRIRCRSTRRARVIARFLSPVTAIERVHVRAALGRVLAEDVISPLDVPAHDNSAMDGYAVRFARPEERRRSDAEGGRHLVRRRAVRRRDRAPGEAVRIMTGGVVPDGRRHDRHAGARQGRGRPASRSAAATSKGRTCGSAGEDFASGAAALQTRPARCGPRRSACIASLGIGEVTVYRRLRVAFFSTGDELVSIGQPLGEGQIYDSNRYTIYGMLDAPRLRSARHGRRARRPAAARSAHFARRRRPPTS